MCGEKRGEESVILTEERERRIESKIWRRGEPSQPSLFSSFLTPCGRTTNATENTTSSPVHVRFFSEQFRRNTIKKTERVEKVRGQFGTLRFGGLLQQTSTVSFLLFSLSPSSFPDAFHCIPTPNLAQTAFFHETYGVWESWKREREGEREREQKTM